MNQIGESIYFKFQSHNLQISESCSHLESVTVLAGDNNLVHTAFQLMFFVDFHCTTQDLVRKERGSKPRTANKTGKPINNKRGHVMNSDTWAEKIVQRLKVSDSMVCLVKPRVVLYCWGL